MATLPGCQWLVARHGEVVAQDTFGAMDLERGRPLRTDALFRIYEDTGFLHDCGFTSFFLRKELEHARPFLVPYLRWSEFLGHDACDGEVPARFLDIYDPQLPTEDFMRLVMGDKAM